MLVTRELMVATDLHSREKILWKSVATRLPTFLKTSPVFNRRMTLLQGRNIPEENYHLWVNCPPKTLVTAISPLTYQTKMIRYLQVGHCDSEPRAQVIQGTNVTSRHSALHRIFQMICVSQRRLHCFIIAFNVSWWDARLTWSDTIRMQLIWVAFTEDYTKAGNRLMRTYLRCLCYVRLRFHKRACVHCPDHRL